MAEARPRSAPDARVRVPAPEALGPGRDRGRGARRCARATRRCSRRRSFALERGEHVALVGAERLGQDDAARDDPRPARARRAGGSSSATASRPPTSPSTRRSSTSAARCSTRPSRRPACAAPRRRSCSAGSSSRAGRSTRSRSRALSGGERRRLALALVVASGANLLVLDEPTNHLDLESREALEAALDAFPGTVLLVTHDRALLDAVSGRLLAIEDGSLVSYPGGWAEYLRRRDEPRGRPPSRPAPRAGEAEARRASGRRRRARSSCVEREIARTEERVAELERQLADDWTNVDLVARPPRRARRSRGRCSCAGSVSSRRRQARLSAGGAQRSSGAIVRP